MAPADQFVTANQVTYWLSYFDEYKQKFKFYIDFVNFPVYYNRNLVIQKFFPVILEYVQTKLFKKVTFKKVEHIISDIFR